MVVKFPTEYEGDNAGILEAIEAQKFELELIGANLITLVTILRQFMATQPSSPKTEDETSA